jgi:hypothetical protein
MGYYVIAIFNNKIGNKEARSYLSKKTSAETFVHKFLF